VGSYNCDKVVHVKTTLNIDDELFEQAKLACGAKTDTETIHWGLEALVRCAAYERLRALRGSEPQAVDVPRRRKEISVRRRRKTVR
jgi:Arc/MetJ family transcription regulator